MVAKCGLTKATELQSQRAKNNTNGKGNKGKPKSDQCKKRISDTLKRKHKKILP